MSQVESRVSTCLMNDMLDPVQGCRMDNIMNPEVDHSTDSPPPDSAIQDAASPGVEPQQPQKVFQIHAIKFVE